MKSLFLEATDHTPCFIFNEDENEISIQGNSKIEEGESFYPSISEFVRIFEERKPLRLKCVIDLSSICRLSKRGMLFFLLALKDVQDHCNTQLTIDWIYDNHNTLVRSIGENLEYMVRMKINFVEKEQIHSDTSASLELVH